MTERVMADAAFMNFLTLCDRLSIDPHGDDADDLLMRCWAEALLGPPTLGGLTGFLAVCLHVCRTPADVDLAAAFVRDHPEDPILALLDLKEAP